MVRLQQNVGYPSAANAGAAAGGRLVPRPQQRRLPAPPRQRREDARGALGERVGIVVPRLLNPDLTLQPSVRPFDTPSVALVRASGLSRCVPNRHQPSWSTHWDHSESREIRAADGAVLLLRAEAWQQLDGFSPRAYMYAEDTDICWRAQRLGWKVRFEATAEFVHLGNATGGRRWSDPERAERWSRSEARLCASSSRPSSRVCRSCSRPPASPAAPGCSPCAMSASGQPKRARSCVATCPRCEPAPEAA